MKHYIVINATINDDGFWKIPVLGSGYYHNITFKYYNWFNLAHNDVYRFNLGNQAYYREDYDIAELVPQPFKGSDKRNWHILLEPFIVDPSNPAMVLFAYRSQPLYVKAGEDLFLVIDGNATGSFKIVIEMEFIPYWNSVCKWDFHIVYTEPGVEPRNYQLPLLLPFSVREGVMELQMYGNGSTTAEEVGFFIPRINKPGMDIGTSKVNSGYGVIDDDILSGQEVMPGHGTIKKKFIITNNIGGISKSKNMIEVLMMNEGGSFSFDFIEVFGTLDAVWATGSFMFKIRNNRRHMRGHFMEGSMLTKMNEFGVMEL